MLTNRPKSGKPTFGPSTGQWIKNPSGDVGGSCKKPCEARSFSAANASIERKSVGGKNGTATWTALEVPRTQAIGMANLFTRIGSDAAAFKAGQDRFASGERPQWRSR